MELHYANFISSSSRFETSLRKHFIGTPFCHTIPSYLHCTTRLEGGRVVSLKRLGNNLDSLILELMRMHKVFRSNDAAGSTVLHPSLAASSRDDNETCRCWTAHNLGQLIIHLWRIQDLFFSPPIPEL